MPRPSARDFQNRYLGSCRAPARSPTGWARRAPRWRRSTAISPRHNRASRRSMARWPARAATVRGRRGGAVAGPARARLAAIQGQLADARARGLHREPPRRGRACAARWRRRSAAARNEPVGAGGGGSANPLYLSLRSMQADKASQVAALQMRKSQLQGQLDTLNAKLARRSRGFGRAVADRERLSGAEGSVRQAVAGPRDVKLRGQARSQTDSIKFSVIDPPSAPRVPDRAQSSAVADRGADLGAGRRNWRGVRDGTIADDLSHRRPARARVGTAGDRARSVRWSPRRRPRCDASGWSYFAGGAGGLAFAWIALLGVEMIQRSMAA